MRLVTILFILLSGLLFAQDETYEFVNTGCNETFMGMSRISDDYIAISGEEISIYNKYGFEISKLYCDTSLPLEIFPSDNGGLVVAGTQEIYWYNMNLELDSLCPINLTFPFQRAIGIKNGIINYFVFRNLEMVKYQYDFNGNILKYDSLVISQKISRGDKRRVVSDKHGNVLLGISKKAWYLFNPDFQLIAKDESATDLIDISVLDDESFILLKKHNLSVLNSNGDQVSDIVPQKTFNQIVSFDCYNDKIALCGIIDSVSYVGVIDVNGDGEFYKKRAIYTDLYFDEFIYGYAFNNSNEYILKTDQKGYSKFIQLEPISEELYPGDSLYIKWDTNIENRMVKVFFIDEDGNEHPIAKNINIADKSVKWVLPDDIEVNNTLYIELEDNPLKFDYHFFDISYYKNVNYINANEIKMWVGNNGMGSRNPLNNADGFFWPESEVQDNGSHSVIFADGPLIGYKTNDFIKLQGSTYNCGFVPGNIDSNGVPTNKDYKKFGIYKAFGNHNILTEEKDKTDAEYAQKFWPIDQGAPWKDLNDNGIYEPEIDEPDIPGKQLLFWVNNTADSLTSNSFYGSPPDNLEIHNYVFDIDEPELKDVVFKRYKIINKTESMLEDAYFGYWSDPGIGNSDDDYCGCDSSLGMMYSFNGDNDDYSYGENPPAVGYQLVQGPILTSNGGNAIVNGVEKPGYENLPLTSAIMIFKSYPPFMDADMGGPYSSTLHMYNFMQGLQSDGAEIINPLTGAVTTFPFNGDPETKTGWYNGHPTYSIYKRPADSRMQFASGPFTMEPGDTQDVVIAIMMARGENNLNSVTKLKELAATVKSYYENNSTFVEEQKAVPQPEPPMGFSLYQNYPNPFNPKTTIEFDLPEAGNVRIAIYDILGREVQNVVKRGLNYGKHYFNFNASGLASGVYFYRLEAGSFTKIKKMVLVK